MAMSHASDAINRMRLDELALAVDGLLDDLSETKWTIIAGSPLEAVMSL
jgi:hypothetical protein